MKPVLKRVMAGMSSWIKENWFTVVQTVGIVGGLWFTAASFRISNMLTLAEQHRALWDDALERPDLKRVFLAKVEKIEPVTVEEEEFLNLVIVHFETGWQMANTSTILTREILARDIRGFFSKPLPHSVWEKTRDSRNPQFVKFVERALEAAGRLRQPGA